MSKQTNMRFKNISKTSNELALSWPSMTDVGSALQCGFVYLGKLHRNHSFFLGKKSAGDIFWVKDG